MLLIRSGGCRTSFSVGRACCPPPPTKLCQVFLLEKGGAACGHERKVTIYYRLEHLRRLSRRYGKGLQREGYDMRDPSGDDVEVGASCCGVGSSEIKKTSFRAHACSTAAAPLAVTWCPLRSMSLTTWWNASDPSMAAICSPPFPFSSSDRSRSSSRSSSSSL